jgi:hypothetical protein
VVTLAHNVDELNSKWGWSVYPYTKPILEADARGRPCPVGSSVLVSLRGKQHLLTANHVTSPPPDGFDCGALYSFLPEQLELTGPVIYTPNHPYDLCLVEIPASPRRCLRLPEHLAFDIREGELCLLFGFPARTRSWEFDRSRHSLRPSPLSYLSSVQGVSEGHFTVKMSSKRLQANGRKASLIKLNGVSGGGVFVLRNDRPRLAGILIEYHKNEGKALCTNSTVIWSLVAS